ncbi:MAG: sensor protein [Myxococcales bacterium]|nr:sensor protein [Myxococcales bacterium]
MAVPSSLPLDLASVFERLPNAFMILDRELRYVAANAAYLRVTGSKLEDLIGTHVFSAFPEDSPNVQLLEASFHRVLATGQVDELAALVYRVAREHGLPPEERVWSARHTPLLDDAGKVAFIVQETTDITHLRGTTSATRVESTVVDRALRLQTTATAQDLQLRSLRQMFAQAPGFMCFLRGPEHVFELVNEKYLQLVGHRDVVGMRARDAIPEVIEQGFITLLDNVYSSGTAFLGNDLPIQLQRTPGAVLEECFLDFIYQPIRDSSGAVVGIFVQGQDVTVQHRAELERSLAEARRQFLIEVVPNQVWTSTPDGKLDFVSKRVVSYFHRSVEQILGDGWLAVLHPDDVAAVISRWTHSLTTGDPYEVEFRLRRGDGEYRWHLGRANAERDADGSIIKWIGTNTDIHDAKVTLAELTRRSQYEQRLIGIVSHDLRNPFNAIGLGSEALQRYPLEPGAQRIVARISRAAERATRLIKDLLDFAQARIGSTIPVNPQPTNLREIVEQVVDEIQAAAPGRVIRIGHDGDETGSWDADRLAQVIANLVGNAVQHGSPGAPIVVESRISGVEAVLTVENEGPGIPADEIDKLFEPYQRGSRSSAGAGSMGLGLYIAREVISAHGGSIEVESSPQATTRFTVRLPRFSSSSAPSAATP